SRLLRYPTKSKTAYRRASETSHATPCYRGDAPMATPAPTREVDHPVSPADPAPVWLQRLSLVVFVLFCFYIGGLLTVLPWTPNYWEHNGWLMAHPSIHHGVQ